MRLNILLDFSIVGNRSKAMTEAISLGRYMQNPLAEITLLWDPQNNQNQMVNWILHPKQVKNLIQKFLLG